VSPDVILIKEAKSVLLSSPAVHNLFPDLPRIAHRERSYVVVPHKPAETTILRRLGHKVPPPIMTNYDFPHPPGETPFEIQLFSAGEMSTAPRFYNLSAMGTGKSRVVLWSWDYLNREGCANKLLIVCKLSSMRRVWVREIIRTLPGRKAMVLHGTAAQRLAALKENADVYIINHDGLRTIGDAIKARKDIDVLCIDELAAYRNNSERSKHLRKFAQGFTAVWGLTGSPMPRAPTDVWGQCKIITPDSVPQYYRHAQSALMNQVSQFKWEPKQDAVQRAYGWMQPGVRFTLDDVTELPPCVERTVDVELTPEQKKAYTTLASTMAVMVKEKKITAMNAGVALGKLLQIAAGYVYTENPAFVTLDSTPRKEALLEMIEECEHKIIIFAPYRHLINGLHSLLLEEKEDVALIHGGIQNKTRDEILGAFQDTSRYRILLSDPTCISHGLTLTAADTTLWYLPITSFEIYEQANARIRRTGQTRKQQFLHLQSTAVERKLYKALKKNELNQNALLAMFENLTEELMS